MCKIISFPTKTTLACLIARCLLHKPQITKFEKLARSHSLLRLTGTERLLLESVVRMRKYLRPMVMIEWISTDI